jgi:rRNA-processing protein FCF1
LLRKVILDSNFLFLPLKDGIDIFSEVERVLSAKPQIILLTPVMEEVKRLAMYSRENKIRREANFALKLAERCQKVNFMEKSEEKVDDLLIRAAEEMGGIIATNDRGLRQRLRSHGFPVIYARSRSHLVLEGYSS